MDAFLRNFRRRISVGVPDQDVPTSIEPEDRPDYRCTAGETEDPTGRCTWHAEHHWCNTCQGFYGVYHDGIHTATSFRPAHPFGSSDPGQCACRPCKLYTGRETPRIGYTSVCVVCDEKVTYRPLPGYEDEGPNWLDDDDEAGSTHGTPAESFHFHKVRRPQ
jgi:hypothetical protein